jgi:hypothetical protein
MLHSKEDLSKIGVAKTTPLWYLKRLYFLEAETKIEYWSYL